MEPWEWPPAAVAAVARDIRATTGRIVDDNSFYESIKWFCDQRPEGCRGAKLQKDGWSSRLDSEGVAFSVSPWDWPRSVGVDVADELHAGATRDYRRARAEDIATLLCRGNTSCAALPAVWKSTSASGAPDNSSLSHFSAMTRPSWLGRAARNRHRHAIEQASRRWRTRRKILISTQHATPGFKAPMTATCAASTASCIKI